MGDLKKKLRAVTAGSKNDFKKEIEEFNGQEFEIRQPSVAIKSKIMQKCRLDVSGDNAQENLASNLDYGAMQVWSVIYCTYVPGTDERVFEETDAPTLNKKPSGSFVDQFSATAMSLMNVQPEEDAKN